MGVSLIVAAVLGILGLAALFVAPWIGAPALAAAVILAVVGFTRSASHADEVASDEPVEAPHMPGPGNPASGVDER